MHFWQEYRRSDAFSVHFITEYVRFICLLTGAVNLDMVKVMSSGFLHLKITLSPLQLISILWRRYSEIM